MVSKVQSRFGVRCIAGFWAPLEAQHYLLEGKQMLSFSCLAPDPTRPCLPPSSVWFDFVGLGPLAGWEPKLNCNVCFLTSVWAPHVAEHPALLLRAQPVVLSRPSVHTHHRPTYQHTHSAHSLPLPPGWSPVLARSPLLIPHPSTSSHLEPPFTVLSLPLL